MPPSHAHASAPSFSQPQHHQPQVLEVRNKRKAMLVGINYHGTRNELGGCINDANVGRPWLFC
jgi:hypothetical protein